jgi:hypothetical protein
VQAGAAGLTCTRTRLVQMQVWPLLRWLLAATAAAAFSTSAGGGRHVVCV